MNPEEIKNLIESDPETEKGFKVLVRTVKRNYPWKGDLEREVLEKMIKAGCHDLETVQDFIMNTYFIENKAGPVFKPVKGFREVHG